MIEECEELNISECLSSSNEENPIKSDATVKYQMVQSPANFARLKCNTDLNVPPTNWLNSSFNSYGLQQALSQSTGFSSFRMAHLFPDCLGEVDVVANAENIKRLLKLPYASNCSISMMVHRIGNTLLIDDFDVHRFLLQQEDCNWKWLKSFICENILSRLNDAERNVLSKQPSSRSDAVQQRSLLSKFLYYSLSASGPASGSGSGAGPSAAPSTSTSAVSTSDANEALDVELAQLASHLQYGPLLPDPSVEENVPDPKHTKHTYNRNLIWTFEDIRMLIGTDMPIFGGSTRPCISLRLRDMHKPINVLTGIDYWLDNLMCNVPEVVMCYHLDGLVQKYEIIKTEDLPFLEDSKFSPNIIRNVAQNILSFLKQNATKSGHTYWLFKGRKDDVVKLYDLTSLCTMNEFGGNTTDDQTKDQNQENLTKKDDKNPFTVPVAMLLYKVARNMKNSSEQIKAKQAGSIKALLDNCIKLLPKEQYPQIVASSFYLLSDLHIPSGTDPMSPKFEEESNESEYSYDDDNNNSDDSGSTSVEDEQGANGSIAVQSVVDVTKESNSQKIWNEDKSLPPPLVGTVDERCSMALQYIVNGLNCLQYFSMNEAKLAKERNEIEKQAEKMRIIQEEQNPNMAKPYQAIPLPYEKLERNDANPSVFKDRSETNESCKGNSHKSKKLTQSRREDGQLFVGKAQPTVVVQSWNVHLKLLFLEKSCLIYTILTEHAYQRGKYGIALKYISFAMKYYDIVSKHQFYCMSIGANYRSNLLARAGDCYFQCGQHFDDINTYLRQFDIERDIDRAIEKELEKDLNQTDINIEIKQPINNMEQLILISISCYETALQCADGKESQHELLGRIGSVRNELGVKYMHWSQENYQQSLNSADSELTTNQTDGDDQTNVPKPDPLYLTLSKKSYDCLIRGIAIFEEINDNANLAILLCNMGRFMRFRAHLEIDKEFGFKKVCYESAFTSYERALTILESKKQNSQLWDLVIWELSSGKFTLAKHILENFRNDMNEQIEQEVIELLLGSLKLCDTQTRNPRQIMYIVRSGLIYHNLGNIYSRSYKTSSGSNRKKKLLNLCRLYYEKGVKVFQSIDAPIEFLAVQVDRFDFQNTFFDGCQTPSQKFKCLQTALSIAYESIDQFDKIEKLDDNSVNNHIAILKQFESHIQTILKHLIQVSINKQCDLSSVAEYKRLYSLTLQSSIKRDELLAFSAHLKNMLQIIQQSAVIQC